MFADDTTIYVSGRNLKFIRMKLQADIENLSKWISDNGLVLNVKKTKVMLFSTGLLEYDQFIITYNNTKLECVNEFKFLGIWFDHRLDFVTHAIAIKNKLKYQIYSLRNISKFLNNTARKIIFYSFIHSISTYGLIVWYDLLPNSFKTTLNSLYQKCIDLCYLQKEANTLQQESTIAKLKYIYKYKNNLLPKALKNLTPQCGDSHNYNTRNRSIPSIPKHSYNKLNKSFIVQSTVEWVKLPQNIKNMQSNSSFVNSIKNHLM